MGGLFPSVMTSSSTRDYEDLFREVKRISHTSRFDLFVLRDSDIEQIGLRIVEHGRMSDVVSDPANFENIRNWVLRKTDKESIEISSLATYFPDLTSTVEARRQRAVTAVANCVQLAIELNGCCPSRMNKAVVEIVCGTVVESCDDGSTVSVFGAERKIDILCKSLREVVQQVGRDDVPYALALELEPGDTYVLNGINRVRSILGRIDDDTLITNHVGFNLDIAHLRIIQSQANDAGGPDVVPALIVEGLREMMPKIVHAHISDHPGIHTHDQTVGSWTNVQNLNGGYQIYLQCLLNRAEHYRSQSTGATAPILPFTAAIGIELEGCNRIFAIHDSISRLEHAIAIAEQEHAKRKAQGAASDNASHGN